MSLGSYVCLFILFSGALECKVIVLEPRKPALLFSNSGKEVIIDIIKQRYSFRAHQGGELEYYFGACFFLLYRILKHSTYQFEINKPLD